MYAIAIDGELVASSITASQVLANLKVKRDEGKVEVASFEVGRGWVAVCLDKFAHAA